MGFTFTIHSLFPLEVKTVGRFSQVVRGEENPEMGSGRLPLSGKRDGCFAGSAYTTAERLNFGRVCGIETNDIYPIVITSRLGGIDKLCIPTESGRAGKGIKMKAYIRG